MTNVAPYGSWESPITTELLTGGGVIGFDDVAVGEDGIYWLERRPHEGGRSVLVFRPDGGEPVDVVPRDFNVRTRVHEYGGGAFWLHGAVGWCSSFADGRIYRFDGPGAEPQAARIGAATAKALAISDGKMSGASSS